MLRSIKLGAVGLTVVLLAGIGWHKVGAAGTDELLQYVFTATDNAADSVRTGRGKVVVREWHASDDGTIREVENAKILTFSGEFFRVSSQPNLLPSGTPDQDAPVTIASYDGNAIRLYYPHKNALYVKSPPPNGRQSDEWFHFSPRNCGFLALSSAGQGRFTAERRTVDGVECLVVEVVGDITPIPGTSKHQNSKRVITVDPNRGFCVVEIRAYHRDDDHPEYALVGEMRAEPKNYGNDTWGPYKSTKTNYRRDSSGTMRMIAKIDVTYAPDFELNLPVGQECLTLTVPSGTKVYDQITDAIYTKP